MKDHLKTLGFDFYEACRCGGVYQEKFRNTAASAKVTVVPSRDRFYLYVHHIMVLNDNLENLDRIKEKI